ncbi:MAG TPA: tripartite tricarboxylate transporter substrate-binding protein, partial [Sphingomonas sp.]|nr:tripartite tricarboxylate transporter substrate-binding protein [Sphingomonas sp.]
LRRLILSLGLISLSLANPAQATPTADHLTLVVPGAPGGGWDITAKSIQHALECEGLVGSVSIVRYPGTGGLVGLTEFVNRHRGDGNILLVGGLSMLGAAIADSASVSLRDVKPIARLTGDWGVIAVRRDSPIRTLDDLKFAMRTRSNALRWSGGSVGSPDQALVWEIAERLHVPVDDVLYYGKVSGRSASESLLAGRSEIAVSGYAEFAPYLESGDFRAIAVDAPKRMAGLDVPTLREGGIDVSLMNWRGVFAAPSLTIAQQKKLEVIVAAMRETRTWRAGLHQSRWYDAYLDAEAFSQFIDRETARWPGLINPPLRSGDDIIVSEGGPASHPAFWLLASLVLSLAGWACNLIHQLRQRRRHEADLQSRNRDLWKKLTEFEGTKGQFVRHGIEEDFNAWELSTAERDVAWFMLRGLPLREIATLRGTSERTVRQQAQSIYRKADLESRSDLAGRVLERFI